MSTSTISVEMGRASLWGKAADFVQLGKPRIATMVLVAVGVSYCVARWGQPDPWVLLHVLVGTFLVAASASALNQWLERDRDALMARTADRPLPAGRLSPRETLTFAMVAVVAGLIYLVAAVGWHPAGWALVTWSVYVWVYTPLKLVSSLNTAVGAIAGATPILIGWSAGGSYDLRAAGLFVVLFLWQFPHFMAIAWLYRADYERAGMRMLPVVDRQGHLVAAQSFLAALILIPVSLVPVLAAPAPGGLLYAVVASTLGLAQLLCAALFSFRQDFQTARRLLRASLIYLPAILLFLLAVPWL